MIRHFHKPPFLISLLLLAAIFIISCNNGSPQRTAETTGDFLYLDYQATGEDGVKEAVVRIQFHLAGPDGPSLLLDSPATVLFDGHPMTEGKSKMNGSYYEAAFLLDETNNQHFISYRDMAGHIYNDTFSFPYFRLAEELPAVINRSKGLQINFASLSDSTPIHTMLTDTSFYGRGIDRVDSVTANHLQFSDIELLALKNGPIHLEFFREEEHYLQRNGRLHGRLYLSYNVSREFELVGK
ncbi:MAG: hypothetical protein ABW007_18885 [Chitinophagaceae bacterium]